MCVFLSDFTLPLFVSRYVGIVSTLYIKEYSWFYS